MLQSRWSESAAVLGRRDAELPLERTAHRLGHAVAAGAGDLVDAVGGLLQQPAGRLEPGPVDVATRRGTGLSGEGPGELARREPGSIGELRDGEVGGGVV